MYTVTLKFSQKYIFIFILCKYFRRNYACAIKVLICIGAFLTLRVALQMID